MKFRFFDIPPVSYARLYEELPRGFVFMNRRRVLHGGNSSFSSMFGLDARNIPINHFACQLAVSPETADGFIEFVCGNKPVPEYTLTFNDNRTIKVSRKSLRKRQSLLCFTDITPLVQRSSLLAVQQAALLEKKQQLGELTARNTALAAARAKTRAAQDMHDILGHSLTVVIGTMELAAAEAAPVSAAKKIAQVGELLTSSLNDLRNTLSGTSVTWEQTSLLKAIGHLKNDSIHVDITAQGVTYELSSAQTEAVFRLCQEAVTNAIKHGGAKNIHIVLRYKPENIEVFAINDGAGCRDIVKNYGLSGIENRISELSGHVEFGSDGEKGFTIHAVLPRVR